MKMNNLYNKNKILITGGSGFIGSHLLEIFAHKGITPYVLIPPKENPWRIQHLMSSVEVIEASIDDTSKLHKALAKIKPDICIHLAWYTEPGKYMQSRLNTRLFSDSIEFAYEAFLSGCRRFITAGTCFEYGFSAGCIDETYKTKPDTMYAASKLAMQIVLENVARTFGRSYCHLRFFYQYGRKEDKRRFVPSVINSLLCNLEVVIERPEEARDYVYVNDTANAVWLAANSLFEGVLNVGSGKPITRKRIAVTIGNLLNKTKLIHINDEQQREQYPKIFYASTQKIKESLGWCPQYSITKGLQETIDWWKTQQ